MVHVYYVLEYVLEYTVYTSTPSEKCVSVALAHGSVCACCSVCVRGASSSGRRERTVVTDKLVFIPVN
jgi:hypothetical protein